MLTAQEFQRLSCENLRYYYSTNVLIRKRVKETCEYFKIILGNNDSGGKKFGVKVHAEYPFLRVKIDFHLIWIVYDWLSTTSTE